MSCFEDFVLKHENDDVNLLLLGKDKYADIDIPLAVNTILTRRKLRDKVPSFYRCTALRYPTRLSGEQCSSEETAQYKAEIAASFLPEFNLADLSGGLGVDTWAFSKRAKQVLHNEQNEALSAAVQANFQQLGVQNCQFTCQYLKSREEELEGACVHELLADFPADIIYLDPARRDQQGSKVFRLEDCSPNVLTLKDELFAVAPYLFLKLSPMADIQAVCEKLGPQCKEVYIIGSQHECKELLVWMDREHKGSYQITVREEGGSFQFQPQEEREAVADKLDDLQEGAEYLFEPSKAMMKAGAFKLISQRYGLKKLADSTHLYVGKIENMPLGLGKCYRVLQTMPFNSRCIKDLAKEYPNADVTARNVPITSDELKKRMKSKGKSAEQYHLFALGCESKKRQKENILWVTQTFRP